MARADRTPRTRRRRWPWVLLAFGILLAVMIGLGLLAKPMTQVKPEADAARDDLSAAEDALKAKDLPAAEQHIASARAHVDRASSLVNGFGGDVWRWVPVGGGVVQDVRHLVDALDNATSIAQISADLYPQVMSSDSLMQDGTVNVPQLEKILSGVQQAGTHLHAAAADLDAVKGSAPFVGGSIRSARDAASERLDPLLTTYDEAAPALKALPDVLGADGERVYLVAMMNPAELRYSGGATLTIATLSMDNGEASFGVPITNEDIGQAGLDIKWPKVKGNPFHSPGRTKVVNATFSPYWSQSGEELLRAWQARYGQKCDGVIAVDLQALARLMSLTGPVQAPVAGELNASNLVQVLAGSYDKFNDPAQRRAINAAVVPAFRQKLFEGGRMAQKIEILADAAKGRHFALYFRDPRVQQAFEDRHLAGDLSDTDHDYVGVFTQNINTSKADYWQHREVRSDVELKADGSADVTLTVTVDNASPPYLHQPTIDPKFGYYTRWAGSAVAMFLPKGAEVQGATQRGREFTPVVRTVLGRPYLYRKVKLAPDTSAVIQLKYTVPHAATVDGNELTYALDVDPQGLVVPENVSVTLHLPQGYGMSGTVDGWQPTGGRTLTWTDDELDTSPRFELHLSKP